MSGTNSTFSFTLCSVPVAKASSSRTRQNTCLTTSPIAVAMRKFRFGRESIPFDINSLMIVSSDSQRSPRGRVKWTSELCGKARCVADFPILFVAIRTKISSGLKLFASLIASQYKVDHRMP